MCDGGCGRLRGSSRVGVVYRGAGGFDYGKGLGGGLRKADRRGFAIRSIGGRSLSGNAGGGGVCQRATRTGGWGRLSARWDAVGSAGGGDGGPAREICWSGGRTGAGGEH